MSESPTALSPADAARLLTWLAEMGADEAIVEEPVDRFAEKPAVARPPVASALPPAPSRPVARSAALTVADGDIAVRAAAAQSLAELGALLDGFESHPLRKTATRHCLHGGAGTARVLVIADRPRAEEDRSGQVFAGKHEVLAERMLAAIGLRGLAEAEDKEQVALASFLPWRPPGNRAPTDIECRMILPVIARAVALIRPRIILALGALPGQWLAGGAASIASQRGKWMTLDGIPMIATFHPETLLKSPASKRLAWHDLLALRARLDEMT